jgi:small subunit ribosomal protein S6
MLKQYETTVIVTPVLTDTELRELISGYIDLLKSNGAEIVHEDFWGMKQLAYPIKKKTSGFYYAVEFKAPNDVIDKLELAFRRDENILRFLSVKLDKYAAEFNDKKRNGLIGKKRKDSKSAETENA